jgi:hypothetical protein
MNTVLTTTTNDISDTETASALDMVKEWYVNRMDDTELLNRMNALKWMESEYDDTQQDDRLIAFKQAISGGRGSTVSCIEPTDHSILLGGTELLDLGTTWNATDRIGPTGDTDPIQRRWNGCTSGESGDTFGPNNIIQSEYEEWSADYLRSDIVGSETQDTQGTSGSRMDSSMTFGSSSANILGLELYPPSRRFEYCMNDLLNEYDDEHDRELIEEIHGIQDIRHLSDNHIQFIKRKLEMLLLSRSRLSVKQCMLDYIFDDKDICSTDIATQMATILHVLFSTIGFNVQLDSNDPESRQALIHIIDEMGDLIPKAIDKIIDITEEIEVAECGGIKGKTMILQEMNQKLFNPPKQVIQIDSGLSTLEDTVSMMSGVLDKDQLDNDKFQRLTILGAICIAVLKLI